LCQIVSLGGADAAVWAALAPLLVLAAASIIAYVLAILSGASAEWEAGLWPPMIRWKVNPSELVQDGGSADESAVVRDEHNGELSVPLEEHSAVR
jgi:hypothetical protein